MRLSSFLPGETLLGGYRGNSAVELSRVSEITIALLRQDWHRVLFRQIIGSVAVAEGARRIG